MNTKQLEEVQKRVFTQLGKGTDAMHDYSHAQRVSNNALAIVKKSHLAIDTNLLQAACYLHDVTYAYHKQGVHTWLRERKLVKPILAKFLTDLDITSNEKDIIYEAVTHHTHSFPFRRLNKKRSLYTQIVQDADTLDLYQDNWHKKIHKKLMFFLPFMLLGRYIYKKKTKYFLNIS